MRIAQILDNIMTLGPGRRACFWLSGCKRDCPGCISPEFRSPSYGLEISVSEAIKTAAVSEADGVSISGGEPFGQPAALKELVAALNGMGVRDIVIFTGNTLDELKAAGDEAVDYVLDNIAALVAGEYVESENDGKHRLLGSMNQRLYLFRPEFEDAYTDYCKEERGTQLVLTAGAVASIGIPKKTTPEDTRRAREKLLSMLKIEKP